MTQDLYQKAMKFAGEKHSNQKVPGSNANYLLHISNVAMEVLIAYQEDPDFDIELAIQLAILHDTLEDTDATLFELKNLFGEAVALGVQTLTKNNQLPDKKARMNDSLDRINAQAKEVAIVKLADRITNLQSPPSHWSQQKIATYCTEAQTISKVLSGKNKYLNNRLDMKIEAYKTHIQ